VGRVTRAIPAILELLVTLAVLVMLVTLAAGALVGQVA
jgi:hypothetical protein